VEDSLGKFEEVRWQDAQEHVQPATQGGKEQRGDGGVLEYIAYHKKQIDEGMVKATNCVLLHQMDFGDEIPSME